ncbi:MAG: glycosyltransferase family 2 protein [Firmicutes bacterium]|jgi:glycosyltransferase involved in cell wall biosynthesis|nr:glycosyltransferase family 2 protein [Bacillota bacterium]
MKNAMFKFSVIVPIYNIEEFLEESIETIIGQTIGFEDNIQLILVNDGSSDDSDMICRKYAEQYPRNIVYIEKENGGVSSARNEGMKHIQGRYVNFFDGDDKWDIHAFQQVYDFFEQYGHEIDVVTTRTYIFGRISKGFTHYLDYKYTEDRVVDIQDDYTAVHLAVHNAFFKKESLMGHEFDTRLKISEDSIFIGTIILEREKYGLLRSAVYYYRRRENQTSAIDGSKKKRTWYFDTVEYCYKELYRFSQQKYGSVVPYIQYHVMNDIQWRLRVPMPDDFAEAERHRYTEDIRYLLSKIDDKIILEQPQIDFADKIFAMSLKYKEDVLAGATLKKTCLVYRDIRIFDLCAPTRLQIRSCKIQGNQLCMEGTTHLDILGQRAQLLLMDKNKTTYPIKTYKISNKKRVNFLGEPVYVNYGFQIKVPLREKTSFKFVCDWNGSKQINLVPSFGIGAKFSRDLQGSYYAKGAFLIKLKNDHFMVYGNRFKTRMATEFRYMKSLLKNKLYGAAKYRLLHKCDFRFTKQKQCVILDGTQGELKSIVFEYLDAHFNVEKGKMLFFNNNESIELGGIKAFGKEVRPGTNEAVKAFLNAAWVVTTKPHDYGILASDDVIEVLKDFYDFEYVQISADQACV